MRIAVVGAGVVGGYFGGHLAHAGEDVVFVERGRTLQALREQGLRVDSLGGNFVVRPAHATDDTKSVGSVDVVLLAVKGWQVPGAKAGNRDRRDGAAGSGCRRCGSVPHIPIRQSPAPGTKSAGRDEVPGCRRAGHQSRLTTSA
jgi:hypothetical protein